MRRSTTTRWTSSSPCPMRPPARRRARLEPEFRVDAKPVENDRELAFSLHASKTMRLVVPDMQDVSRRLGALASEFHGRYDGWAAGRARTERAAAGTAGPAAAAAGRLDARAILKSFETPDETRDRKSVV